MTSKDLDRNDRLDIAEVLVRYATGIDRRDWDLFRSCFTDDCQADYGAIGSWDGAEAITAVMEQMHAPLGHTLHRITNVDVRSDGDGGALARSYVDALVMLPGGEEGVRATGFYDDVMVRAEQGWQIRTRRFTEVLVRSEVVDPPGNR